MTYARWLPIIVQFGIGALLGGIGLWGGIVSGYLDWRNSEDQGALYLLIAGYILFLLAACLFTFYLPFIPETAAP